MEKIEKTVFISYRRTNVFMARAVYMYLTDADYDVFFDYEGINSGDFEQVILGNIRARAHFIVILAPSALERCANVGDWLRREIETALDEKRNIIPLFFEGFNFGSPSIAQYLTGKLALLKNYNGMNVPSDYFNEAMDRLINRFLNTPLDAVLHPLSNKAQKSAEEQKVAISRTNTVTERELSAEQWLERGVAHMQSGDLDDSVFDFTQAINIRSDFGAAYHNRGTAYYYMNDLDKAIKDLNQAIHLESDQAYHYYNRGMIRDKKGDSDGAIRDYTEAIRLEPAHAEAYYNRGLVREDTPDWEQAIKDFTEAIRLGLNDADSYYERGILRKRKGDQDGALKDFDETIRLKPDSSDAYINRGNIYLARGDIDHALADYNEAIRINSNSLEAYNNRGFIHRIKRNIDSAISDCTKAISLDPELAAAYYNRALAKIEKTDYASALFDCQNYLKLNGGIDYGNQREVEDLIYDLKKKIG